MDRILGESLTKYQKMYNWIICTRIYFANSRNKQSSTMWKKLTKTKYILWLFFLLRLFSLWLNFTQYCAFTDVDNQITLIFWWKYDEVIIMSNYAKKQCKVFLKHLNLILYQVSKHKIIQFPLVSNLSIWSNTIFEMKKIYNKYNYNVRKSSFNIC